MNAPKTKVLCVDDSATIRELLTEIISDQPDLEVVASAPDPIVARELIKQHNPDVLTLDIKMPRMNGLDFLERLMRLRPMPVLMLSAHTQPGSDAARRALELGARDVIVKPKLGIRNGLYQEREAILEKIRAAARTQPLLPRPRPKSAPIRLRAPVVPASDGLIVMGASAGGTNALPAVLDSLPANSPPVLIAQHMPAGFTNAFAKRLDRSTRLMVKEAQDGEPLLQGHAYLAPGDRHLKVARRGEGYIAVLDAGPEVNRHRPAVDVLFHSAAQQAGRQATGVLLTGMGKDGAAGLLALRETGAVTIAQDEASSLIFGMPREAIEIGAAAEVLALEAIAPRLQALSAAERPDQRHAAQPHAAQPHAAQPHAAQPHAPRPLRQAQRAASSASLQRLRGAGFKAASRREQA